MFINYAVIVQANATPAECADLGTALWRWCTRASGHAAVYGCLDNQALADLLAGRQPVSPLGGRPGVYFRACDDATHDRRATLASLRREIPARGVEDVLVDGKSWSLVD